QSGQADKGASLPPAPPPPPREKPHTAPYGLRLLGCSVRSRPLPPAGVACPFPASAQMLARNAALLCLAPGSRAHAAGGTLRHTQAHAHTPAPPALARPQATARGQRCKTDLSVRPQVTSRLLAWLAFALCDCVGSPFLGRRRGPVCSGSAFQEPPLPAGPPGEVPALGPPGPPPMHRVDTVVKKALAAVFCSVWVRLPVSAPCEQAQRGASPRSPARSALDTIALCCPPEHLRDNSQFRAPGCCPGSQRPTLGTGGGTDTWITGRERYPLKTNRQPAAAFCAGICFRRESERGDEEDQKQRLLCSALSTPGTECGPPPAGMLRGLDGVFLTLSAVEFLLGMLGNVLIGVVNCREWVKHHKLPPADLLLTCLALSRIIQLLVYLLDSLLMGPTGHIPLTHTLSSLVSLLWRVTNHLTIWLASGLSIYYLLKIANFSHSFFLWLRWRVNGVVLVLLVFSLPILIFDSLVLERLLSSEHLTGGSNLTSYSDERKPRHANILILLSMTYIIPFLLSLTSLVLLFLSLGRHTRSLQLSSVGSRDSRTEAHRRAMRMVATFLLLLVVHFVSTQSANWLFSVFWRDAYTRFLILVTYVFPTGHSFILILGNKKLKRSVLKVLWYPKSLLKRKSVSFTDKMPSKIEQTFLLVAVGEFVIGVLGNGFIVLVNCGEWARRKGLSVADCLLTGLALSRISHLCVAALDCSVTVFWPQLYGINRISTLISVAWMLNSHLMNWLATCLSVFYFFKIANFPQPCFVWLRWRMKRVLLVLLLGSLPLLFANLMLTDRLNGFWNDVYNAYVQNSTWPSGVRTQYIKSLVASNLIDVIPFLLSVTALLLLFFSLLRHTRALQLGSSARDRSTEAHRRAMRMVMSFLFLFGVHFSASALIGWSLLALQKTQAQFAVILVAILFPSSHSFILILGNRKLQQAALQALRRLTCHLERVNAVASLDFLFFLDMVTLLLSILSVLVMAEFVLGNLANGFIALVNCFDWIKTQRFSLVDRILTALAVSRIGLLWMMLIRWCAMAFKLPFYSSEVFRTIINIAWAISHHFSIWFGTSLSIFYMLKIADVSSPVFLYLKWRVKTVLFAIHLGSVILLFPHLVVVSVLENMKFASDCEGNVTWKSRLSHRVRLSYVTLFTLANLIPFAVSLASFLLLIFSLWKHLKRMQLRGTGSQDPGTRVHVRAMQTVVSFLLLFAGYFLIQIISIWNFSWPRSTLILLFCKALGVLYPASHSCVLIWGNKKLRQACVSSLRQLRHWLEERKRGGAPESSRRKQTGGRRDTLPGMSAAAKASFLLVVTGEIAVGMLGNGLIALVHCREWARKRRLSPADFILTGLAVARILQLWVTLVDSVIVGLFPHLYASGEAARMMTLLWSLSNHLTTWAATCLSIFYFLKIANFSHLFFVWLKWRMNRVLLGIFLGSLFLLCATVLLQDALTELWMRPYREQERNMTLDVDTDHIFYLRGLILLSMTFSIPFLLSLTSLVLLFLSLVRHTRSLQLSSVGSRDSRTEAHRRAMKMVATFLLLFIIYFISVLLASWDVYKVHRFWAKISFVICSSIFLSGHSFIIILGNNKLRQVASRLWWHLNFSGGTANPRRDTLPGMSAAAKASFLLVVTGEIAVGMLGNGLIALVHCREWARKRRLSPADFILTGLAVARILQLWVTLVDSVIVGLFPHLYASGEAARMMTLLWSLSNHLTTWAATCLSIFYFLKIANFSHLFFVWLKWRMNRVLLGIFLGSLFLLCATVLLQDALTELWMRPYREQERNMTLDVDTDHIFYLRGLILLSMTFSIPFLLSLTSLVLLFLSLVRHTRSLQLSSVGSRDSRTEAHRRAMKMVVTFLLLFIIYFTSVLIENWVFLQLQRYQAMMIFVAIASVFPSVHSFIIILGNNKLRQTGSRLLYDGLITAHPFLMMGFIVGNLANGFIVLVNGIDWAKKQSFSLVDGILAGLAVSRIGLIWATLVNRYATVFFSASYTLEVNLILNVSWSTCNHLSTWLATCLNIFYLFKIANFSNLMRITNVVPAVLLGSWLFWALHIAVLSVDEDAWTNEYDGNTTAMSASKEAIRFSHMTVATVENFIPFLMSLTSFLLLIFSLRKHLQRMQLKGTGPPDHSTEVHVRAIQTVVSFLLLFAIFILAFIIAMWSSNRLQNKLSLVLCESLLVLFPSSHSCVLIWGNKKLRQACVSSLRQLRHWLEERKRGGAPESSRRKQTDMIMLKILFFLVMTGFVLGNLANGFIVLVNCSDWVKRRKFSWTDRILTALAVSRISFLWVTLIYSDAAVSNAVLQSLQVRVIVNIVWVVSNHFSIWLVTILSILYLLKIANFSSPIFLHLKRRVVSVLIIMFGSLPFLVIHFVMASIAENTPMDGYAGNLTFKTKFRDIIHLSNMTVFTLVIAIPFTMFLASFLLLIFSLWRHLKRMQLGSRVSQDPSTKVHIRVLKTMVSFLLMFAIFFTALIISVWSSSLFQRKPVLLECLAVGILHLSIHSLILIWGNKKLRQACVSSLMQLRHWLEERKWVGAPKSSCRKETDMLTSLLSILLTLVTVGFIVGNVANGFIALVNCIDWAKRQQFSSVDQILTALAISRIGLLWITLANWYVLALNPVLYSLEVRMTVHITWTVTDHFSLWFATCLSIFYLLKMANFSSLKFPYLKWRVKRVIHVILLGSFIFLVAHLSRVGVNEKLMTNEHEGNITWNTCVGRAVHLSGLIIFTLANFIPFAMSLLAFLLLVLSLWKHHRRMQLRGRGSQDPSTRVHVSAMQTVVSFFLPFACYILVLVATVWSAPNFQNRHTTLFCQLLGVLYPASHSCVLIWGNKKLRQACVSSLRQLRHWLEERKRGGAPESSRRKQTGGTMVPVFESTLLAILSAEFVIGKLGNSFIALVNCMDWAKRRKISFADGILTALAVSRIALLWVIFILSYVYVFNLALFTTERVLMTILTFWTLSNHFSLWLATSLSIFYFLKIATFSDSIFLYLKWRVKRVVSLTMFVSSVLLALNLALVSAHASAWYGDYDRNATCSSRTRAFVRLMNELVLTNTLFSFLPFAVTLVVFLQLIFSLGKHLRRTQLSGEGSRDASTKAHIKALQSVVAFLLLHTVFLLALSTSFWSAELQVKNRITMFCHDVAFVYPSGHACVLILGNQVVSALNSIFIAVISTEFIIGILGNGFVTLVNCIDWLKTRKISSADGILTALAISRICMILIMTRNWFRKVLQPSSYMNGKEALYVSIARTMASHFSIWLATVLSLFYFFKIANFSNPLFLYLKHRVDMVVLVTLLGSSVTLPLMLMMVNLYMSIHLYPREGNMTLSSKRSDIESFSKPIVFTIESAVPFSISLTFLLLLIFSLWKHLKAMKSNTLAFGNPNIKARITALKTMMSFLLLFAMYFLMTVKTTFNTRTMKQNLSFLVDEVIANAYPLLHSLILILGNSKLRKASLAVLRRLRAFEKVLLITEIVEFLIGTWGNGLIVLVTCADWVKTKKITLLDFVFTCWAVSSTGVMCFLSKTLCSHMLSIVEVLLIFVAISESILGVLGNGIIGVVYCTDYVKNRKFSTIGFILVGLATSRICLIGLIMTDGLIKIFFPDMYASGTLIDYISYLWIILNQSTIWFATCLNMFYFLKIANFSHRVFLWLKSRINRFLALLMGSLLISWLITFPQIMKILKDQRLRNSSTARQFITKRELAANQVLFNLGVIVFFTLTLITCFMLIISLWRHSRQMHLNVAGFRDLGTEAHMKAMKILISFVILFILYFIGIAIEISCYAVPGNKLLFIFGMTITVIYPWGHSFILILGNNKLKQGSLARREVESSSKEIPEDLMTSAEDIFIVAITVESVTGLLGNGYIALASWRPWMKKRKGSSMNCILLSLASSRICLLFIIALDSVFRVLKPHFYENHRLLLVFSSFWALTNYLSMWFATCLNVFYLLKIANFSHPLFLWLKWRVDRVILWLLLGCLAISSLFSLIVTVTPRDGNKFHKTVAQRRNVTEMFHVSGSQDFNPMMFSNLFIFVPFSGSLLSFVLLMVSLWRHTKQMRLGVTHHRDPSTEAHVRAMKNVAFFLFLLFVYCGACLLVTFSYFMKEKKLAVMFGEAASILYPSGHSLILIIGNKKLKQALARRLRCVNPPVACNISAS
ncbi:LOW QUALITY PROTEIN: Taste receptor type 2 member 10, partial [Galemys pyrenaicus]